MHRRSVALVCVGLLSVIGFFYNFYSDLFASLLTRGASNRFTIWQNWYDLWQGDVIKVFFGHGFGASTENMVNDRLMSHYHNFYLNTFFYVGTVGIMLFFVWVISVVRSKAIKNGDYMPWYPVLFGVMAGFMTDGDKLFNYPGALVFCFILPAFCIVFENKRPSDYEEIHAD